MTLKPMTFGVCVSSSSLFCHLLHTEQVPNNTYSSNGLPPTLTIFPFIHSCFLFIYLFLHSFHHFFLLPSLPSFLSPSLSSLPPSLSLITSIQYTMASSHSLLPSYLPHSLLFLPPYILSLVYSTQWRVLLHSFFPISLTLFSFSLPISYH